MDNIEIEKQWFDAFNTYGESFELARPNYEGLDKNTQIVGVLMKLELDMNNGGFIQFFCNWGYSAYLLAVSGLEQIGASTAKKLLEEAFLIINKYENDKRIKTLLDLPVILSDEDVAKLDGIDERYWEDEDEIMNKMLSCFN
jgi:hypothetical protein